MKIRKFILLVIHIEIWKNIIYTFFNENKSPRTILGNILLTPCSTLIKKTFFFCNPKLRLLHSVNFAFLLWILWLPKCFVNSSQHLVRSFRNLLPTKSLRRSSLKRKPKPTVSRHLKRLRLKQNINRIDSSPRLIHYSSQILLSDNLFNDEKIYPKQILKKTPSSSNSYLEFWEMNSDIFFK